MPKTTKDEDDSRRRHTRHPDRATLAAYRDDKLDARAHERLQDHVSTCSPCRTEFLGMCRAM